MEGDGEVSNCLPALEKAAGGCVRSNVGASAAHRSSKGAPSGITPTPVQLVNQGKVAAAVEELDLRPRVIHSPLILGADM